MSMPASAFAAATPLSVPRRGLRGLGGVAGAALVLLVLALPGPLAMPLRVLVAAALAAAVALAVRRIEGQLAAIDRERRALRHSETQFRALADHLPDVVLRLDREGRLLYANQAAQKASGKTVEQLIGSACAQHGVAPALLAQWDAVRERVLATGDPVSLQFEMAGPGGPRTWELRAAAEADPQGRIATLLAIGRDITERRRLQEAVRRNERRLAFLLNSTPAVIYSARHEGDFGATFYSANVRALVGWTSDDFLSDPGFWQAHVHPDDRPAVQAALQNLAEQQPQVIEYRFAHRDGRWRWMRDEMRLVRGEPDAALELIGSWIDITGRRDAEDEVRRLNAELEARVRERTAQLQLSEARYRSIFDNVPVAIAEQDWSAVRRRLAALRAQGVQDGPAYFAAHPEWVRECLRAVRVMRLNQKARELLALRPAPPRRTGWNRCSPGRAARPALPTSWPRCGPASGSTPASAATRRPRAPTCG